MNQMNVVPYIDVMLVLLVIFMIAAPLINPGQIELPQVGQSLQQPAAPMEITIRADNSLYLRDGLVDAKEHKVSRDDIVDTVRRKQEKNPDQPVVIAADKSVRYEEVLRIMDVLQQAQVKHVGLLAKPRSG